MGGKADQGLAFFTVTNQNAGADFLYTNVDGTLTLRINAKDGSSVGGTKVQQAIDKAQIILPAAFGSVSVAGSTLVQEGADGRKAKNGADLSWSVEVNNRTITINADKIPGTKEGLWPGDYIDVPIKATPTASGTFTQGGTTSGGVFTPDGSGIQISAAVQHDITDPNEHAVQIAPPPSVVIGIGSTTACSGSSCSHTLSDFKVSSTSATSGSSLTMGLASLPGVLSCQSQGANSILFVDITNAGSKTITEDTSSNTACWGAPKKFYAVDSTGQIGSAAWNATNNEFEGVLPTCRTLLSYLQTNGLGGYAYTDEDGDGDGDWDDLAVTDFPCVQSSWRSTLVIFAPAGDPRLTN